MSGPLGIILPELPKKPDDLSSWAMRLYKALAVILSPIQKRLHEVVIEGTFAAMPTAKGSKRFYFATDTSKLYYDAGSTWIILN